MLVLSSALQPVPVQALVRCQSVHGPEDGLSTRALEVLAPELTDYQRSGIEYALQFTSFKQLLKAYELIREGKVQGANIYEKFMTALRIHLRYRPESLAEVPATGPLVVTSNHPYGGLDGIILLALLNRIRPDVKFMAAAMLAKVPELQDGIIPINFEKTPEGANDRKQAFAQAMAHVAQGGALIVFPAGAVAQAGWMGLGKAVDSVWRAGAARILQATGATSVSVNFPGQNSYVFQLLGRIPGMRPLFLGREVVNKADNDIQLLIAPPVTRDWTEGGLTAEDLTLALRQRTDELREP